ncbi:MAG: hypothetical protein PHP65_00295 [Bacilli bacterium]|jgi:hypothetical protein|nr:hypothetical protein [Bacilli bacterium]
MKKLFVILLAIWIMVGIKTYGYSPTGHDNISAISFIEEGELLVDMTSSKIDSGFKALGRNRFIGWKYHYFNIKREASYVGEIIFARSNRTNEKIEIDYSLRETNYQERSIKTTGSISGQFEGNIKKIEAGIEAEGSVTTDKKSAITRVEDTSFSFVVDPFHRITFRVTGDAYVTNGVSKYSLFGITFKKGTWEYIDIITRYYELYEEELPK